MRVVALSRKALAGLMTASRQECVVNHGPAALVPAVTGLYSWARSEIAERGTMIELLGFISSLITLYIYIIIAGAVMSWLIAFNVVNPYNQFVRSIWQGLNALTEPLLGPIRRRMPDLGGIDISPVVLIIACWFVQGVVLPVIARSL